MKRELRYWDSACFLAVMKNEPESYLCEGVIQAAEQGKISIITSTWTLTEVIRITKKEPMTKADDDLIRRFFQRDYITLLQLTQEIGHMSRRLVWDQGYSTKDAVHVATALVAKCSAFDTFDKDLIRKRAPSYSDMCIAKPDISYDQILPLENNN